MNDLTRERVLAYLADNPSHTTKRDIARGMGVHGEARKALREILKSLEADGKLNRVGKRAFARADTIPPTGVVQFTRVDDQGDLVGRMTGRDGPFGPDIIYYGPRGKRRDPDPGVGDRALCDVSEGRDGLWRAKMIKRLETARPDLLGVFKASERGGRVESASRKDKRTLMIAPGDTGDAADGDLVRCEALEERGYGLKKGRIVEVLGEASDPKAASLLAMAAHNIPDRFDPDLIAAAENAKALPCKRVDLTQTPLITIDPSDARDHDDAVFAEPDRDENNQGGWRLLVAIADVAAYVRRGTALDDEACKRANSTYFPDRVAPMLPEALSADQCSLREGELRDCMALEIIIDRNGRKKRHTFIRATMRSASKIAYEEAQAAIDGKDVEAVTPALLEDVLKPLWAAYGSLTIQRKLRDPLDLDLPERKIEMSPEGKVVGVRVRERLDAHRLIEEFMVLANVCAAETLEAKKSPLIYRVHDEPSDEKIHGLSTFLDTIGIKWARGERTTPTRFNRLLEQARKDDRENEISEIVLRSQSQAIYSPDNLGHFGLNLARYAHFTSPIRRYSDLIVHRALIAALDMGEDGLTQEEAVRLEEISGHLVERERASMAAEREANDRYLTAFLADRIGAEFGGRITGVQKFGLFVKLNETGADGFIPAARISQAYWTFDEAASALVSERSGERYELGQTVRVKLAEADTLTGSVLLEMLSDPRPKPEGASLPRARRSGAPRRGSGPTKPRSGGGKTPARSAADPQKKTPKGKSGKVSNSKNKGKRRT